MVERKAKHFHLGNPYLAKGGACYFWPSSNFEEYPRVYNELRKELGAYLLERAKSAMKSMQIRDHRLYPYLQSGRDYEILSIGDGGQWLEFGVHSPCNGVVNFHNVDGYKERVLGFNLASDAVEFLDPTIFAPRIEYTPESNRLIYPRVAGKKTPDYIWNVEWINRVLGQNELARRIMREEGKIELKHGVVEVRDDVCVGVGFDGFHVVRASFLMAKLADSFCVE